MKILSMLGNKLQQQAFVLNLAFCSIQERSKTVEFMFAKMRENLCPELKACIPRGNTGMDVEQIQSVIYRHLPDEQRRPDLWYLMYSIKGQLNFLKEQYKMKIASEETIDRLHAPLEELLELLGMKKYYPQKLRYEDVTMLRTDDYNDVNRKPVSLQELPWYFMKRILVLDSKIRDNCIKYCNEEDDDVDASDEHYSLHPLDLIYIIFLCADDFLRQELSDKMSKCQYAVPFILPSPLKRGRQHKELFLFWALQAITRDFYQGSRVTSESFIDIKAPLIACLNVGKEVTWKSKLLNKMLSQQQETFWHKGLLSGECRQIISQGMVEIAGYLPGNYDDNIFTFPVIFMNIRSDDISQNKLSSDSLADFSSVCCIFVESVDQDLFRFLLLRNIKEKVVLVILYREGQDREWKLKCKNLQEEFNLEKHQVICKSNDFTNFTSVVHQLKNSITHITKSKIQNTSLSDFVSHAKREGKFEVDDMRCYIGHMAAESILKDVDECNEKMQYSAKAAILPCNADLKSRQDIAALDKELCRQRKIVRGNTTVQNYAFCIKEQKWQIQLNQLQYPTSSTFRYFLQCLVGLQSEDRRYFLQSLKLGLNKRSVRMLQLQPLYEEYDKCRAADKVPDRDANLKEIERKIARGSLGLEHFFRELAIMYENLIALREKSGRLSDMDVSLDILVGHMSQLLVEGTAIELLNSDAMDVPVSWLNAIFRGVENCTKTTLFKVSALGAQSSGKSTLLNAVFGSNFPVSSGRCTRGAYMQLVQVEDTLKQVLKCSCVAIIDSEGLMSRSRIGETEFDNELATFIIGLSDLTLLVIKGEGSEMQDILPLAIHVFLKMNIVGEHQAVHFVHQYLGAVDAASKGSTEIEAFVRHLNAKTLAAAKEAQQSKKYSQFTDILRYNPTTDNSYVPTLWDGSPPMGENKSTLLESCAKTEAKHYIKHQGHSKI